MLRSHVIMIAQQQSEKYMLKCMQKSKTNI